MILQTVLKLLRQSKSDLYSQQIQIQIQIQKLHTSPLRASYRVALVRNLKKIDRVITAPHCILKSRSRELWVLEVLELCDRSEIW